MSDSLIRNVVVLGGGSAGFLAAITLRTRLPDLPVTVVRSKDLGIIGVGEGTTFVVPNTLHGYLGVDPGEFHRVARPTWKLGIRFLWGPRPHFDYTFAPTVGARWSALPKSNGYYCDDQFEHASVNASLMSLGRAFPRATNGGPVIGRDVAYHIENADFVTFLETHAARLGVATVDDTVEQVDRDAGGAVGGLVLKSGRRVTADLFVDCSGFASVLLGKTLGEPFEPFTRSLFCDRAVVGGWDRPAGDPIRPYTTAETMDAGWCWRIDHEHRVNRGYVYSSAFAADDAAEREFRARNPQVGPTRVVRFAAGMYARAWVGNVVAIGNAGGFVEPLESTSLSVICDDARGLAETLAESDRRPTPTAVAQYNRRSRRTWEIIRQFLAVHYKFNTRLDTAFWRACRADVDLAGAEPIVDYYRENGPSLLWQVSLLDRFDPFGLEGYFTLLLGQQAPCDRAFVPSAAEREVWAKGQAQLRAQAEQGLTVRESLDAIRSPNWGWHPDFYRL